MKPLKDWPKYCSYCGRALEYYLDFESFDSHTGLRNFSVRANCSLKQTNLDKFLDGFLLRFNEHTRGKYVDMATETDKGEVVIKVPRGGTFTWGTAVPGSK